MNPQTRPTILVVDDERINRNTLAELLRDEGRIILAKDGPSALQRVASEKISLILLDACMPDMDGYEVLRRLKADEKTANIGVIFVTGQTSEQNEERGLLLGAADYIAKPIRPLLVRARVRNHLKFAQQREDLERLSLQDGLTGIANRRCFDLALAHACRHTMRSAEPLGLAIVDVDHFKSYNDRYGHGAGDQALRTVAHTLAAALQRPYDLVARYGGEEFALLLPGTRDFSAVLEQLREKIAALNIAHDASGTAPFLTVSCGGIVADAVSAQHPGTLLERSDTALYQAKKEGRNRVVISNAASSQSGPR